MGIEQIIASSGKIAEAKGVFDFIPIRQFARQGTFGPVDITTVKGRVEGKPISAYKKGELISGPTQDIQEGDGGVFGLMQTLGPSGLWNIYTRGGAYGGKEAVKTTFYEYWGAKGYDKTHLDTVFSTSEWENWNPQSTVPWIPQININPADPTGLGGLLPDFGEIGKLLLYAGLGLAGVYIAGKLIK